SLLQHATAPMRGGREGAARPTTARSSARTRPHRQSSITPTSSRRALYAWLISKQHCDHSAASSSGAGWSIGALSARRHAAVVAADGGLQSSGNFLYRAEK